MKIYIATDLEGVCCVVGEPQKTLTESKQYEFAREQLTKEVNAATEGALAGGAAEVLVTDGHGGGINLVYDKLHPEVRVLLGTPRTRRFLGLDDSFTGVFLVGYHPMSGTEAGILAHSYSSVSVQNMWLNGEPVGEIGFDSAVAGVLGVPVVFVSSCRKGVEEARAILGDVETVAVKDGLGRNAAVSLSPQKALTLIREKAERAVRRIGDFKPLDRFKPPFELKTEYKFASIADSAVRADPSLERVDGRTVVRRSENLFDLK